MGLVFITGYMQTTGATPMWSGCALKTITDIPCPSCGSTRTILEIIQGDFSAILSGNPLGLIWLPALFFIPFWIIFDMITSRSGLYNTLNATISYLEKNTMVCAILATLITLNWIWNIFKGL